ncbi:MAG: LON peptidase substrate-binding domain-containing protein, partial [Clostridia bacterium]|nr:LON peptidase substrate-binding domain-containing protein [Clostridia bacterium]
MPNAMNRNTEYPDTERYLTVCLDNLIIFPGIVTSFEIDQQPQIQAAKKAQSEDMPVIIAVKGLNGDGRDTDRSLLRVALLAKVSNLLRLTNGHYQMMVEGIRRVERVYTEPTEFGYVSDVRECGQVPYANPEEDKKDVRLVWSVFEDYLKYIPNPSEEVISELKNIDDPGLISDLLASNFLTNYDDRKTVFLETDGNRRAKKLADIFGHEIAEFELNNSIQGQVRYRLSKRQREIYLREQMNTIRAELGMDEGEAPEEDDDDYAPKIKAANLPKDVEKKLLEENAKLQKIPYGMAEGNVIQSYLDTCLELPWNTFTDDCLDLEVAKKVLDEDHDGIEKVKERILEFLSVLRLNPD